MRQQSETTRERRDRRELQRQSRPVPSLDHHQPSLPLSLPLPHRHPAPPLHSAVNKHLLDNKLTCWLSKQRQLYACFYDKELDYGKQHYVVTAADRRPTAGGSEANARLKKIWCLLSENGGRWGCGGLCGRRAEHSWTEQNWTGLNRVGVGLQNKGKTNIHTCMYTETLHTYYLYCMLKKDCEH